MEEILASIRRIISEDDAPAETAAPALEAVTEPEPEPFVAPVLDDEIDDGVLELTEPYEAPAAEVLGDLDIGPVAEPAPEPVYDAPSFDDALVGEAASAASASAFAGLAAVGRPGGYAPSDLPFDSGNTVEDMVRAMLRPMMKSWLDANLPAIVEREVRKEVERIARTAG